MIISLHVHNFVLIDHIDLDFQSGFNVFTGETGAGKSLLVDAIALLCGAKASHTLIKANAESAKVDGVFAFKPGSRSEIVAQELGIDTSDVVVLSREITRDGRNVCRINGKIVPLALLKELATCEIDIHSQHDTTYLLNEKQHLFLLDQGIDEHLKLQVKTLYHAYKKAQDAYHALQSSVLNEKDLDFVRFQLSEITAFNPSNEDYELCEAEIKRMSAYEKLVSKTNQVLEFLDSDNGVLSSLYQSTKLLQTCHEDEMLINTSHSLHEAYVIVEDVRATLFDRYHEFSFDQDTFDELNARMLGYEKLKRKHGGSLKHVLETKVLLQNQLSMVDDYAFQIQKLSKNMQDAFTSYEASAFKLREHRILQARKLEDGIKSHLSDLSLVHAQFKILLTEDKPSASGIDKVTFHIKTNPGSPLGPLAKIASGGELSRLMLGLKCVFTPLADIQLVIFDEIDVGISGPIAKQLGLKMRELANDVQVFSITHLAMVAVYGHRHFKVVKNVLQDTTQVGIVELDYPKRIEEIALIASGSISDHSRNAAIELLASV